MGNKLIKKQKSRPVLSYVGDLVRMGANAVTLDSPRRLAAEGINRIGTSFGETGRNVAQVITTPLTLPTAIGNRINAAITSVVPDWTHEKAVVGDGVAKWTIDKDNQLARYYDKKGKLLIVSPTATGLIPGDKHKEGDNKTPNGTYTLSSPERGANKKGGRMSFGDYFYRTNHKNDSGGLSHVGIHGTGMPIFNGSKASHGCIRIDNRAIKKFHKVAPNNGAGSQIVIYGR